MADQERFMLASKVSPFVSTYLSLSKISAAF